MAQNKPAHQIKLGNIRAAIWINEGKESTPWFSVTLSRLYKDGDDWKDTTSLRRDDLPVASKILDMAYQWIWFRMETEQITG